MKNSRLPIALLFITFLLAFAPAPAAAKDTWTRVKSKNFMLIGNASEKDIRKVATRLEQFRESFRLIFLNASLTSPIPTNVIVFKNDGYYRKFKPKLANGKTDNFVAGYFQAGEDVNYITVSVEGDEKDRYRTIFHEYVHFIMETNYGKTEIPPWLNEGMAEYFSTFEIADDQNIKIGLAQFDHLRLLETTKLIPLATLFSITNYQLPEVGDHSRSIFYAESWALIHYLKFSDKADQLNKFFQALVANVPAPKAFQDAFKMNYDQMERELRNYVSKNSFQYREYPLKQKLVFDADMQASLIDEGDSQAYLGDLLYHIRRVDDAEPILLAALALNPVSSMANTSLGMVKLRQRKFDDAKKYLEAAIAGDARNHAAYYRYAVLLTQEGRDEDSVVTNFEPERVEKIRKALTRAIEINPAFTESYDMMAFVALVTNEKLDEAIAGMRAALKYQPGNQRYAMRIAELLVRQNKFDDSAAIAKKIAETADDPEVRGRATALGLEIARMKDFAAQQKEYEERNKESRQQTLGKWVSVDEPRSAEDQVNRTIGDALRKPKDDEKRFIGHIQKIDCKTRPLGFLVRNGDEKFTVTSVDFDSLTLGAYTTGSDKVQVGCEDDVSLYNAVITYRPQPALKGGPQGVLVAIEFVPDNFKFLDPLPKPPVRTGKDEYDRSASTGTLTEPPPGRNADEMAARNRAMSQGIRDILPKPKDGEKQEMGFVDKMDCTNKGVFFVIRTTGKTLRLLNAAPQAMRIAVFTPAMAGMQFGCTMKAIEVPAVFIYTDKPDAKLKSDGEIVALAFVPKSFTLEP